MAKSERVYENSTLAFACSSLGFAAARFYPGQPREGHFSERLHMLGGELQNGTRKVEGPRQSEPRACSSHLHTESDSGPGRTPHNATELTYVFGNFGIAGKTGLQPPGNLGTDGTFPNPSVQRDSESGYRRQRKLPPAFQRNETLVLAPRPEARARNYCGDSNR